MKNEETKAGSVKQSLTAENGAPVLAGGKQQRPTAAVQLTGRQREVLAGIASGRAHKQVAAEMGISYQTLCTHRKELYRRLGIHCQVEAASVWAGMKRETTDEH